MTDPDSSVTDRLTAVGLFSELEPDHLEAVSNLCAPFEVGAGHVLVQPGMVGSGLFLISEGTVVVSAPEREFELGPGEFFGELALLDDRATRTMRVRARTPVTGVCIARDDFTTILDNEPKIARAMLGVLARRLVDLISSH